MKYFISETGEYFAYEDYAVVPDGMTSVTEADAILATSVVIDPAQTEREWRNGELNNNQWLATRHRDEADLELEHTLNLEQFKQLLSYLQALRDWPQSPDFPAHDHRPIQPDWISEQTR